MVNVLHRKSLGIHSCRENILVLFVNIKRLEENPPEFGAAANVATTLLVVYGNHLHERQMLTTESLGVHLRVQLLLIWQSLRRTLRLNLKGL